MKKANKIFTRAFIILLAMVLLTSSAVSTTFAKYVVNKDVTTNVGLQKFGLTVDLDYSDDFDVKADTQQGHSLTVTFNDVTLIPGEDKFKDAITARVYGTATVDANLKIEVIVTAIDDKYTIDANTFDYFGNTDKVCVPMAFYVGGTKVTNSYTVSATGTNVVKKMAEKGMGNAINAKVSSVITGADRVTHTADSGVIDATIKPADGAIDINNIGIGFAWEDVDTLTYTSGTPAANPPIDEIGTWVADLNPTFTVQYKITLEQV